MAKKKNNNSKSNAASVETIPRASSDDAAAQPLDPPSTKAVEDMSVQELRAALLATRAELDRLKAQAGPAAGKLQKPQEVQELHAKLQQLRREQEEADAARDKAWGQLKAVVAEISELAQPDYLQSLVVPKPHTSQ